MSNGSYVVQISLKKGGNARWERVCYEVKVCFGVYEGLYGSYGG